MILFFLIPIVLWLSLLSWRLIRLENSAVLLPSGRVGAPLTQQKDMVRKQLPRCNVWYLDARCRLRPNHTGKCDFGDQNNTLQDAS